MTRAVILRQDPDKVPAPTLAFKDTEGDGARVKVIDRNGYYWKVETWKNKPRGYTAALTLGGVQVGVWYYCPRENISADSFHAPAFDWIRRRWRELDAPQSR